MGAWADFAEFLTQAVTVEPYDGDGAYGPTYTTAETIDECFVEDKRQLVLAADGTETIAQTTVWADKAHASAFLPESRVTVNGRVMKVIVTELSESGDLDLPDHILVRLQ